MKIHRHNVAMRWITRRRTNEVAGLYESFPGTFSAYQEALSGGFQGTMEEFIQHQSIPQSDRPFTGAVGGRVGYRTGKTVRGSTIATQKPVEFYVDIIKNMIRDNRYVPPVNINPREVGKIPNFLKAKELVKAETGESFDVLYNRNIQKRKKIKRAADPEKRQRDLISMAERKGKRRVLKADPSDPVTITDRERALNFEQRKYNKDLNLKIRQNPDLILKDKSLMDKLSTTVSKDGNIIKVKPTLDDIKNRGIVEVEHQRDIYKKGKLKDLPYNRNFILGPYNREGGFKKMAETFIEKNPDANNIKVKNIIKKAEELGVTLQPNVPKGTFPTKGIGYKQVGGPVEKFANAAAHSLQGSKLDLSPKKSVTALQELMQRQGAFMDPALAGRAVVEETGSLVKKPMTKTLSVLKNIFETRTPLGGAFWAAEAPLLILQGAYGRYASERDFRKALKETGQFDEKTINLLGETYGQELSDLGNVGLESYAVDQTDTSQIREGLKESGMSMDEFVKMGGDMVGGVRDDQAAAKKIEKQRIEDAYKKEIGRRTVEFKKGGRVSFKLGGMGRRGFLKLLAALGIGGATAGTGLIKLGGKAASKKAAVKAGADIVAGTQGMPSWFPALVNKIIKEGDDVTKKLGTIEREIVHTKKFGKGEEVTVYQDLNTGNVRVDYQSAHSEVPIQMDYRAPQVIDEGKMAGQKTDPEFEAVESEPKWEAMGPDDADLTFEGENVVGQVDDLTTDTSKLKEFATNKKLTLNEIVESKKKRDYRKSLEHDSEIQADYIETKYGPGPEADVGMDEFGNLVDEYGEIID